MSMKRQRPKSFSPASFQDEGRNRKGKSFYVCDKKLSPRLRQLLSEYSKEKQPSLDEIVGSLQEKYGEYGRKKKGTFKISVQKVYQTIKNESAEEKKLQHLEEMYLGKRKDQTDFLPIDVEENSEDSLNMSSDSELTDEEMRVDFLSGNLVNESMHEMYKASNSRRNSEEETDKETLDIDVERTTVDMPLKQKAAEEKASEMSVNLSLSYEDSLKRRKNSMKSDNIVDDTISKNGLSRTNDPNSRTNDLSRNENTSNDKRILKSDNTLINSNNTPDNKTKGKLNSSSVKRGKKRQYEEKKGRENDQLGDYTDKIPSVPSLKFSDLGGCDECIQEVCKLLIHMKHPEVFKTLGITPPRGFLLHGPPGCGKTLLAHVIAGELDIPLVNVASTEMVSGVSGESEAKIRDLFARATAHAPCVLFLDEIDAITPKRETASKEMERRIVAQLLSCLDELNRNQEVRVVVIGATNRPDSLDPALRRAGRFDREIRMGIPDEKAREKILLVQCKDIKLSGEFDFKKLAQQTPGFVGADLMALAREAAICAVTRIFRDFEKDKSTGADICLLETENASVSEMSSETPPTSIMTWLKSNQTSFSAEQLKHLSIEMEDFTKALQDVQPSAKREGFATIPDVTWDDIGALEDIREELTMAIIAPVRHRETFAELGLTNPPGILLTGPPGCGKTLLAKAIANESGINFISVKGPELLNMYVGESERAVRQVFQRARNSAPCVIFFDELDALCPRRSDSAQSNASARVVNQLLTEMDGLETRKQVFIMAATNRPDIIDPAILRPGRLDKVLYVGLPGEADRLAILLTLTKKGTKPRLCEDVDLMTIASDERCRGLSGADLAALVREASVNSLREYMKGSGTNSAVVWETPVSEQCKPEEKTRHHVGVGMRHFDIALEKIKPSVSQKEQLIYRHIQKRITPTEKSQVTEKTNATLDKQ